LIHTPAADPSRSHDALNEIRRSRLLLPGIILECESEMREDLTLTVDIKSGGEREKGCNFLSIAADSSMKMHLVPLVDDQNIFGEPECSICQSDFVADEPVRTLP